MGASRWTVALGESLHGLGVPIVIVDRSALGLQTARLAGLPTLRVGILSVIGEEVVDLRDVEHVLAATPDDAYNALVCTRFAPELGRERVHQIAAGEAGTRHAASREWRGKTAIADDMDHGRLADLMQAGGSFVTETIDESGSWAPDSPEGWPVAIVRTNGDFAFFGPEQLIEAASGDSVVRFHRAALAPKADSKRLRWRELLKRSRLSERG